MEFELWQHRGQSLRSVTKKGEGNQYSIAERRVPELIPVLGISLLVT